MKNYKKILSIAMLFMFAFCVGCNKDETENNDEYDDAFYRPGKYSSVLTINDSAMTLEVLVDTDRIKEVRLYMDASTAAMYPLFIPAANDIGEQLAAGTAFDDLELNESSRYTQTFLIDEIKKTLVKASLSKDSSDSGEE